MEPYITVKVKIAPEYDCGPFTDYFGAYTDDPYKHLLKCGLTPPEISRAWKDGTIIDRTQNGRAYTERNTYRYFVADRVVAQERKALSKLGYASGVADFMARKTARLQYQAMEDLNNQYWGYVGIHAEAEIKIGNVTQTIESGGIGGVEFGDYPTDIIRRRVVRETIDENNEHIRSTIKEELADLEKQVADFCKIAIPAEELANAEIITG